MGPSLARDDREALVDEVMERLVDEMESARSGLERLMTVLTSVTEAWSEGLKMIKSTTATTQEVVEAGIVIILVIIVVIVIVIIVFIIVVVFFSVATFCDDCYAMPAPESLLPSVCWAMLSLAILKTFRNQKRDTALSVPTAPELVLADEFISGCVHVRGDEQHRLARDCRANAMWRLGTNRQKPPESSGSPPLMAVRA
eukprot:566504-Rhodomonas_salina.3